MPAYVLAMMTVNDPETYKQYTDRTPATIKKFSGRFLTRGEPVKTLEGTNYEGRMVLVEFPSQADVEAWYADSGYQEAISFRHAAATTHMLLVQESELPKD
jgi:uncharacterized protein (DUF1330 family)